MKQINVFFLSLCLISLIGSLNSCREDIVIDTPEIDLSFSLDTLRFDTVFTEIGTITRFVKVYNNELDAVIIDNISLANSDESFFRLNADGIAGQAINDIRVEGQDSVYIFVEATINPNNPLEVSPFVIEDNILINVNESDYSVQLEAWGQNANYIPSRFSAGDITAANCNGTLVWNDSKPYVIYGVLAIDQCNLVIEAGTEVFVHGGIAINENGIFNDGILVITEAGSLTINGTPDEPVTIKSDRLEESFQEVQGQWGGILIQSESRNNRISNTIIQHSIVGISVDSAATLDIQNTEISFTSGSGLIGSHAFISAENCLFHSNAISGISINYGGFYSINHCTVANYDNQGAALSMNNFRCTDPLCEGQILVNPLVAELNNCLFVGNEDDEISLVDLTDGETGFFDYQMNNCIVTVDELLEADAFPEFFDNCNNCENITRQDTLFFDLPDFDYHLDTLSLAIDFGIPIQGIETDLEGNPREIPEVDAGCYEFQK